LTGFIFSVSIRMLANPDAEVSGDSLCALGRVGVRDVLLA
jgi:hypothetical protein